MYSKYAKSLPKLLESSFSILIRSVALGNYSSLGNYELSHELYYPNFGNFMLEKFDFIHAIKYIFTSTSSLFYESINFLLHLNGVCRIRLHRFLILAFYLLCISELLCLCRVVALKVSPYIHLMLFFQSSGIAFIINCRVWNSIVSVPDHCLFIHPV